MGACLATDEAAIGMTAGVHGTTFGGNPLAMAVGNAVLDVVLAEGFLDEVGRKALLMKQGLAAIADEFPEVDCRDPRRRLNARPEMRCTPTRDGQRRTARQKRCWPSGAATMSSACCRRSRLTEDEIRVGLSRGSMPP